MFYFIFDSLKISGNDKILGKIVSDKNCIVWGTNNSQFLKKKINFSRS